MITMYVYWNIYIFEASNGVKILHIHFNSSFSALYGWKKLRDPSQGDLSDFSINLS